jgi:hypothetical protein
MRNVATPNGDCRAPLCSSASRAHANNCGIIDEATAARLIDTTSNTQYMRTTANKPYPAHPQAAADMSSAQRTGRRSEK